MALINKLTGLLAPIGNNSFKQQITGIKDKAQKLVTGLLFQSFYPGFDEFNINIFMAEKAMKIYG